MARGVSRTTNHYKLVIFTKWIGVCGAVDVDWEVSGAAEVDFHCPTMAVQCRSELRRHLNPLEPTSALQWWQFVVG